MDQKFSHRNSQQDDHNQVSTELCGVSTDLELSSGFHTGAKKSKANQLVKSGDETMQWQQGQ